MGASLTQESDSGAHARRLGRYALLEKLPAYGMVQPYVGRADGEVELRIVKRLLLELSQDEVARGRFEREAIVAGQLRHPNVVGALESGHEGDVFFLVSEWIRGVSLHAVQARLHELRRRMPVEVFATIALRVLDGIAYAHAATDRTGIPLQIVHRDLAPRSILLSFGGEVKIADFGVARAEVADFRTRPGTAVGSVPYMSPEQARGESLDRRSDLYTLGVVFYELLAARPVVAEGPMLQMLRAVASEEAPPLAALRPDLPPGLVLAVQRALAKDREERWPDAQSFAHALAPHLPSLPHSEDLLSRFVRQVLPQREVETVALMARIRDNAAALEARASSASATEGPVVPSDLEDRPQREVATQVVRRRAADDEAPPEPSVMTMPGAPLAPAQPTLSAPPAPAPRPVSRAASLSAPPMTVEVPPRRAASRWIALAAGGVALGLGLAAWFVTREPPPTAAPAAPVAPVTPTPAAAAPTAPSTPSVAPKATPEVAPKSTPRRRGTRSASPASPPARARPASAVPPPPAAPPAAAPPSRYAGLRARVRALKDQPRDYAAFSKVHAALVKAAAGLSPAASRKVLGMLDAAERAYDVELLEKALRRIERG